MKKLALVVAVLMAVAGAPSTAATVARPHSVDYVIGMLEAGVPSRTIIARIDKGSLTFTVGAGDVDRLKAAGADEALVRAVKAAATSPVAPPEATQAPEKEKSQAWSRPPRLAEPRETNGGEGEDLESGSPAESERPHGGYPYYRPGDDDDQGYGYGGYSYDFYYGYPFYDPFYVPYFPYYYSYYGYYSPYYQYNYGPGFRYYNRPGRAIPRGSGRFMPRGSGGRPPVGGAPRGRPAPRGHH